MDKPNYKYAVIVNLKNGETRIFRFYYLKYAKKTFENSRGYSNLESIELVEVINNY